VRISQSSSRYFFVGTTLDTVAKPGRRKGRPNYPLEFKKQLAQAACDPNASVSRLALEHGINANMLFKWRRQYRAGLFGPIQQDPIFFPVSITADVPQVATAVPAQIEITFAGAVIRINGNADAATMRAILQGLRA
jgi:transposase